MFLISDKHPHTQLYRLQIKFKINNERNTINKKKDGQGLTLALANNRAKVISHRPEEQTQDR